MNDPTTCGIQTGDQLADVFSMTMDYDSTINGAVAQYNGNIGAIQWNTILNGTCGARRLYRFTYDYADRLLGGVYYQRSGTSWLGQSKYNENGITYDLNGNIKTLVRQGATTGSIIDNLTYTYDITNNNRPDRLLNVADSQNATKGFKYTTGAADYQYDANGNLTQDNHKPFTFTYNYLNLPLTMTKSGFTTTISYTADGEKLSKTPGSGAVKNYVSGIEYSGIDLEAIYTPVGRCTPNGATGFYYEYTVKDHLGNARVSFRANGTAVQILQENHYYPFGLEMEGTWATQTGTENAYQYNGKEYNEDSGLNWYDYGARWYDAAVGRWWSVDPMGEKYPMQSTYSAIENDPVNNIDPDGRSGEPVIKGNKIIVYQHLILYGGEANNKIGKAIVKEVQNLYNKPHARVTIKGQKYTVKFKVTYEVVSEEDARTIASTNTDIKNNFIRAEKNNEKKDRSFFSIGGNNGFFYTDDDLGKSTTAPHEIGHGLGLIHSSSNQIGDGQPDIMAARGTLVDPEFQYDPNATPGSEKGVLNPYKRRVYQSNIIPIFNKVTFDENGKGEIGEITNKIYNADGNEL